MAAALRMRGLLPALLLALLLALGLAGSGVRAAEPPPDNDAARVLQTFQPAGAPAAPADATDLTRRWVMFGLGAPLFLLLLATAGLGIAMGVYGKPVYLAHMICAGLTITLALVHVVVGLVWFRPF